MNLSDKRADFRNWLGKFIEKSNVQVTKDAPGAGVIIVCTAVEDWREEGNLMWEIDANKSYPRNVNCSGCKRQVVMSNGMYEGYLSAGRAADVKCGRCAFKI